MNSISASVILRRKVGLRDDGEAVLAAAPWRRPPSRVRYNFQIVPDYKPQTIEKKWQERWRETRAFEVTEDSDKPKFYCLEMFAYPSGTRTSATSATT